MPTDGRLRAFVWSWAAGQPGTRQRVCLPGRERAVPCRRDATWSGTRPASSAHDTGTSLTRSDRRDADSGMCREEFPGSRFGVPPNGYRNRQLHNARPSKGATGLAQLCRGPRPGAGARRRTCSAKVTLVTSRYGITFPFDGIPLLEQRPIIESLARSRLHRSVVGGVERVGRVHPAGAGERVGADVAARRRDHPGLHARARDARDVRRRRWRPPRRAASFSASGRRRTSSSSAGTARPFDEPYQKVRDTLRFLKAAMRRREGHRGLRDVLDQGLPDGLHAARAADGAGRRAARRACCVSPVARPTARSRTGWRRATYRRWPRALAEGGPGKELAARIFVAPTDDTRHGARGRAVRDRGVPDRAGLPRVPRMAGPRRADAADAGRLGGGRPQGGARGDPGRARRRARRARRARRRAASGSRSTSTPASRRRCSPCCRSASTPATAVRGRWRTAMSDGRSCYAVEDGVARHHAEPAGGAERVDLRHGRAVPRSASTRRPRTPR